MLKTQNNYHHYLNETIQLLKDSPIQIEPFQQLNEQIQQQELLVPVIGAFSAGKSSLLNSLLSEEVLPVGIAPETELATELRYGTDPHLLAIRADESSERFEVADIGSIKGRASEFTHLRLYLNNPRLKAIAPLILVDMPGFGSSLENHNKAISYYLPRGVYFVVLVSVDEGNITRSMLRQISELQTFEREFVVLVSKANLRASHEVDEVVGLISDQLETHFAQKQKVATVGLEGGEHVANILSSVDSESIFQSLFLSRLKDQFNSAIGQINVAKAAINNDGSVNEQTIIDLNNSLKQIEKKRDQLAEDLQGRYSDRVSNNCVEYVGRKLSESIDELASLASKNNTQQFNDTVFEIVRDSFSYKLKEEIKGVSIDVVDQFYIEIKDLNQLMPNLGVGDSWTHDLSDKIKTSLEKTGGLVTRLGEHFSSSTNAGKAFKTIATVLAITTGVLAPILEIVIVFLPEIINFFNKGNQEKQVRTSIQSEIIPSIKAKLRKQLPEVINEQLGSMIRNVSESFESELAEKREIIAKLEHERNEKKVVVEDELNKLSTLETQIRDLANTALYQ